MADYLKGQLAIRQTDLDAPSNGMDGMIAKEYVVGERAGIMLAMGLPSLMLSGLDEEIEGLKDDLEEGNYENTSE